MKKNKLSNILAQLLLLFFVIIWIMPTFGLFISSLRDKDLLAISGWWTSLIYRMSGSESQIKESEFYIIKGNFFNNIEGKKVLSFGTRTTKQRLVGESSRFL